MDQRNTLDISWKTIAKVVITIGVAYFLFAIKEIVVMTIFAVIIAILLKSAIDNFHRGWMPRWGATTLVYVLIFGSLGALIYFSAPVVAKEVHNVLPNLSHYLEKLAPILERLDITSWENLRNIDQVMVSFVQSASQGIFSSLATIFGGLASTFFVLALGIFISLERKGLGEMIAFLTPVQYQSRVKRVWRRSRKEVSHWFNSRIICALFIAASYFLVYQLFGVRASLILALIAAVLNFIPYIGTTVATLLGVLMVGIESSWAAAFLVLVILILIQQVEEYILLPMLTRRFTGLPPYLVLLALAVGGSLFGIIGAILAIPITAIIYRFIIDFQRGDIFKKKKYK